MDNLVIIAAIIICGIAVIIVLAPRIRRWIRGKMIKENDDIVPLFNCSIASKGNESGAPNSSNVYDCIETNGEIEETGQKD